MSAQEFKSDIIDSQKWDDRELGASEEHVEVASSDVMNDFKNALSEKAK